MAETKKAQTREELLREADLLERMGGDWDLAHAGAYCRCSADYIRRSDCPKHYRRLNGTKGKVQPYCKPAEVKAWNASRDVEVAA